MNASIEKRKADDQTRKRLRALDETDGGNRLYTWTVEQMEKEEVARPKKADVPIPNPMLDALTFLSVAAVKPQMPYQEHVRFANGFAMISNGTLTAGYPIEEQFESYPHYDTLLKAVKRGGDKLSITQLEKVLSVRGAKLRVQVPCMLSEDYPELMPDSPLAVIDDRLKKAFEVCGSLVSENGKRLVESALLLEANVCTGTNGKVMMQYWHGIDLPPLLVVPKMFADAVIKTKQPISAFGWTQDRSITFYFEGGMWIKTQLYADQYPSVGHLLDIPSAPIPVLEGLWEAIDNVSQFEKDDYVYLADNQVKTHMSEEVGAQYEVKGLQGLRQYDAKMLNLVKPYATTIDFTTYQERAMFFGDNMRGTMMGIFARRNEAEQTEQAHAGD